MNKYYRNEIYKVLALLLCKTSYVDVITLQIKIDNNYNGMKFIEDVEQNNNQIKILIKQIENILKES